MGLFSRKEVSQPSGYVNVIAQITARPAYAGQVRMMLEALVHPAREEEGCKGYHLLEDANRPGVFCTYEVWASEHLLNLHLNSESTKHALAEARPMLNEEMQLTVYRHLL